MIFRRIDIKTRIDNYKNNIKIINIIKDINYINNYITAANFKLKRSYLIKRFLLKELKSLILLVILNRPYLLRANVI